MVLIPIKCPHCESIDVRKYGTSPAGKQRYICLNSNCKKTFQAEYKNKAWEPRIRSEIYFLTINGNGIRAISRILCTGLKILNHAKILPKNQKLMTRATTILCI